MLGDTKYHKWCALHSLFSLSHSNSMVPILIFMMRISVSMLIFNPYQISSLNVVWGTISVFLRNWCGWILCLMVLYDVRWLIYFMWGVGWKSQGRLRWRSMVLDTFNLHPVKAITSFLSTPPTQMGSIILSMVFFINFLFLFSCAHALWL